MKRWRLGPLLAGLAGLGIGAFWWVAGLPLPAEPGAASSPAADPLADLRAELERERVAQRALAEEVAELRQALRRLEPVGAPGTEAAPPPAEPAPDPWAGPFPPVFPGQISVGIDGIRFDEGALTGLGVTSAEARRLRERYVALVYEEMEVEEEAMRFGRLDELRARQREVDLAVRTELGPELYDLMIFGSGRLNRVLVTDVLRESAAEAGGVRPGDYVRRYAGQEIYGPHELRRLTTQVELGTRIPVQVEREGRLLELTIDAGPFGATLRPVRALPRR